MDKYSDKNSENSADNGTEIRVSRYGTASRPASDKAVKQKSSDGAENGERNIKEKKYNFPVTLFHLSTAHFRVSVFFCQYLPR